MHLDDDGNEIEDTTAIALLMPHQQRIAHAAIVARELALSLDAVLDADYRTWIDYAMAAKAMIWRKPTRRPYY